MALGISGNAGEAVPPQLVGTKKKVAGLPKPSGEMKRPSSAMKPPKVSK